MRPPGVYQRFLGLVEDHDRRERAQPEYRCRRSLMRFVNLCGRQRYMDRPVSTTLSAYHDVLVALDDPAQIRTGTDFERRSFACVDALRHEIEDVARSAAGAHLTLDEEDLVRGPMLRIPPITLLGESESIDVHFHLVCWNRANCLLEGVEEPYWTARGIANMRFFRPDDPYGISGPIEALAERYEDHPDERPALDAEIHALVGDYLTRVPWPLPR